MLNSFNAIGRLVADVDLKQTPNEKSVARFNVAIQRDRKDKNGEYQADFLPVVVWNQPAEFLAKYANKGDLISLSGRIQTRNYENQQGQRVYVTEVIAQDVAIVAKAKNNQEQNQGNNQGSGNNLFDAESMDIDPDDLPF
uniref:single-stranded DNA-binding protein n=1 Tax=Streptococcus pluranimalium TaxID=82348 RepID=UPI003F68E082